MKLLILILITLILLYGNQTSSSINQFLNQFQGRLPQIPDKETYKEVVMVTAYTLSVDETDLSPDFGACGSMYQSFNIVACPRSLNCGTWIKIDNKLYRCWDRMNIRNDGMYDLLMETKQEARIFGRQTLEIEVIIN